MRKAIKLAIPLRTLLLLGLCLKYDGAQARDLTVLGETMGTSYRVRLTRQSPDQARLKTRIDALLERINDEMSSYRPQSELSRLSANPSTDWIAVSRELHTVLAAAREVSIASDGAFDITVGPLVNLWGFGPTAGVEQPPSNTAIQAARARVGYRLLELADSPPRVRKARRDLYLDLSAIAKGYAVDEVAALLEAEHISDYLVDIGGELRARGHNAQGELWQVGVALPVANMDAVERVLAVSNTGLATSGDYRNFFEYAGQRYSHEIDPSTGRPIANDVASVSVLHPSCMMADAYATAFMVMGAERALALAQQQGLQVLILLRAGKGFSARATPGFPAPR